MASLEHRSHIGSLCRLDTEQGDCMVAGIKKDYIVNIMESAQDCAFIDRIVLFGSALEERCREDLLQNTADVLQTAKKLGMDAYVS